MRLLTCLHLLLQLWTWGVVTVCANVEQRALDISFSITDWDKLSVDRKEGLLNLQGNYAIDGGLALTPRAARGNVARVTTWERFTMFNAHGVTSFATTFTFYIKPWNTRLPGVHGHGFTFAITDKARAIASSDGGYLGLYNPARRPARFVAVEFDTFKDEWDFSSSHVGLDVGSIHSVAAENYTLLGGPREKHTAWIDYDARNMSLTVRMARYPLPHENATVLFKHQLNLMCHVEQGSFVGFTASVGGRGKQLHASESHVITSWSFHSWLEPRVNYVPACS